MVSEKEAFPIRKKEQSSGITHCTKKWSFPLRISSVNVSKSAVSCNCENGSTLKNKEIGNHANHDTETL